MGKTFRGKSMRLGGGGKFAKLKAKVEAEGKSPAYAAGVAAKVGREKYGAKKMAKMSATGRKRAALNRSKMHSEMTKK